mmetsp:Transcript_58127/g.180339  ORF Transcript_58127/g.180339 Transcript_58127/m.180339 type:complete len:215 (-) Transcript_58127:7-651(-)
MYFSGCLPASTLLPSQRLAGLNMETLAAGAAAVACAGSCPCPSAAHGTCWEPPPAGPPSSHCCCSWACRGARRGACRAPNVFQPESAAAAAGAGSLVSCQLVGLPRGSCHGRGCEYSCCSAAGHGLPSACRWPFAASQRPPRSHTPARGARPPPPPHRAVVLAPLRPSWPLPPCFRQLGLWPPPAANVPTSSPPSLCQSASRQSVRMGPFPRDR